MTSYKRLTGLDMALKALALLAFAISAQPLSAAASTEIQTLMAAYLNNFMKLTEWPIESSKKEIVLCTTQNDDFARELESLTTLDNQGFILTIKKLQQGDNAGVCQLLYFPSDEKPLRVQEWLKLLKDVPVLTVSDAEGFLDQGGMIALIEDDGRLQFEVNLPVVERVKIRLSSKMLQIARTVRGN